MNPYPSHITPHYNSDSSNSTSSSYSYHDNQDHANTPYTIRWKSGERFEFFHGIFHGDHEQVFKKIGDTIKKKKQMKKSRSMKRSRSMRAMIRYKGINEDDQMRLGRFKIRAPNVIVAAGDDDDGDGDLSTYGGF